MGKQAAIRPRTTSNMLHYRKDVIVTELIMLAGSS